MPLFICPCCGQSYDIDVEIEENLRFFCERCQRKLIFHQGRPIPFGLELPREGNSRQLLCPYCASQFVLTEEDRGEYDCPACAKPFYVLAADGVPPPTPSEIAAREGAFPVTAAPPVVPESETPVVPEPGPAGAANPLLAFGEDRPEFSARALPAGKVKVGMPRPRSGLSGVFIGIAEKLCGN